MTFGPADVVIPDHLVAFAEARGDAGRRWLDTLPQAVVDLSRRWEVELEAPLGDPPGAAGWLAPGRRADGTAVMLKLGWPHPEARTEARGLQFFAQRGAVRLLAHDEDRFALLLDRVTPGDDLWSVDVATADGIVADVLGRLWRPPGPGTGIGSLADAVRVWSVACGDRVPRYDAGIVAAAVERGRVLVESQPEPVVLHGDLNPFNVLRSSIHGWIAVDLKPLTGNPAFDLAQYLGNRVDGVLAGPDPSGDLIRQVDALAGALDLDPRRVTGWARFKAVAWNFGVEDATLLAAVDDEVVARA